MKEASAGGPLSTIRTIHSRHLCRTRRKFRQVAHSTHQDVLRCRLAPAWRIETSAAVSTHKLAVSPLVVTHAIAGLHRGCGRFQSLVPCLFQPPTIHSLLAGTLPSELVSLLAARTAAERETAWASFLAAYSVVLLRVARSLGGDGDAAMDRYAFMIEQLRLEDFRRLRALRHWRSASTRSCGRSRPRRHWHGHSAPCCGTWSTSPRTTGAATS